MNEIQIHECHQNQWEKIIKILCIIRQRRKKQKKYKSIFDSFYLFQCVLKHHLQKKKEKKMKPKLFIYSLQKNIGDSFIGTPERGKNIQFFFSFVVRLTEKKIIWKSSDERTFAHTGNITKFPYQYFP